MNLHPHLRHGLLASALLLASGLVAAAEPRLLAKELQQARTYTVSSAPTEPLRIDPPTLPDCFEVTAWSETQEIMGIRHRDWDLEGVQFHPESILSEQGHALLANFLNR